MENKEKLEIVGLDKKPKYWDDRYMDGIEKMTPRKYDAWRRGRALTQVRDGVTLAVNITHARIRTKIPSFHAWLRSQPMESRFRRWIVYPCSLRPCFSTTRSKQAISMNM